ncbi:MAG: hypothetical protein ACYTDU_12835 [Planctomycetota bacterium]
MRSLATVLILALAASAKDPEPSCVTHCHGEQKIAHAASAHAGTLACVDCHGGNPAGQRDKEKSHDPAAGYRGRIPRVKVPELCAHCHSDPLRMNPFALPTDQLAHYRASNHGRALFEKGDTNVAVCVDCHGTHEILAAHDPRSATAPANLPDTCGRCHSDGEKMKPYGLPTDSVARFLRGVHGRALRAERRGAPSCAGCHGSHGATPPGVREVVQVCGQCHVNTQEHYRQSPHRGSSEMQCRACHEEKGAGYRGAGCTACHYTHETRAPGDWMYQGDEVGQCGHCHREPDASREIAAVIRAGRRRLEDAMEETRGAIRDAKARGLFIDQEEIYLRESARALVSLQPLAHSLDRALIDKALQDGLKRHDRAREVIAKRTTRLRDRRILVGGLTALLLLLTGLLAAKLRAVRRLS